MEWEWSDERTKLAAQFHSVVMLLNLCNAVQSAKPILSDVENKLSIRIRKSN